MEFGGLYGFQHLPKTKFPGFEAKGVRESLEKWSMLDGLKVQAFSFSRPFKAYLHEEFIQDFLSCPAVTSTLERATSDHRFGPIGILNQNIINKLTIHMNHVWYATEGVPAEKIQMSEIRCTLTSMQLFDKLFQDDQIVRKSGTIIKCLPEYITPDLEIQGSGSVSGQSLLEIEVGDKLRKLILIRDGDEDEEELGMIFTPEEKDEFLFRLFGHLVVGGSLCQYEDLIHPYIETTKTLYKDLVSVTSLPAEQDEGHKKLQIVSSVYKIHSVSNEIYGSSGDGDSVKDLLFYKPQFNNFFYIFVNPLKQICYTLYHHV